MSLPCNFLSLRIDCVVIVSLGKILFGFSSKCTLCSTENHHGKYQWMHAVCTSFVFTFDNHVTFLFLFNTLRHVLKWIYLKYHSVFPFNLKFYCIFHIFSFVLRWKAAFDSFHFIFFPSIEFAFHRRKRKQGDRWWKWNKIKLMYTMDSTKYLHSSSFDLCK